MDERTLVLESGVARGDLLVRGRDVYRDGEIVVEAGNGRVLLPDYVRATEVVA